MAQIFISYKRTDKDKVFPLVKSIENELGCKCWVDLDGIESSMQFASVICRAIDNAEVVLFMHSAVHLSIDYENDWTVKELNYAQQKRKRVVLVRLDGAPLDNIFLMNYGSKSNIDSRDPLQFEKLLNDLRSWLQLPQHKSTQQPEVMCPCGSGKLFKDCHGRSAVAQESPAPITPKPVTPIVSKPVEHVWKVGDYYNVDGKKGIVFWVDDTGRHGKIVSLDQKKLQWCTSKECLKRLTGIAVDKQDGMKNLQSIMKICDWRNKYPAFAWCAEYGDGWYLPAIEELKLLLLNDDVYDAMNAKFYRLRKTRLFSKSDHESSIYWSSTESDELCAWGVYLSDGIKFLGNRNRVNYVRAVSAF